MFVYALSRMASSSALKAVSEMEGRVVLITGATSGIGLHAAKSFYRLGASLILTCRDVERGKSAVEAVMGSAQAAQTQTVHMLQLDLCSLRRVDEFCSEVRALTERIDVLVCNAGVMGMPFELTTDGVEMHFATNQLGHFVVVRSLVPLLETVRGRIIIVSSGFYKQTACLLSARELMGECLWEYSPRTAYANSKLANCLYAKHLAKRLSEAGSGVSVFCVRPGFVRGTELGRHTHWALRALAAPLIWAVASSLDQGVSPILHCARAPLSELTSGGMYYGKNEEQYAATVTEEQAVRLWSLCEQMETTICERSRGKISPRNFLFLPTESPTQRADQ